MNYLDEIKAQRANEVHWDNFLMHHGTKGQKWGIRKYQNEDGSLTPAGREHYGYGKGDDNGGPKPNGSTQNKTNPKQEPSTKEHSSIREERKAFEKEYYTEGESYNRAVKKAVEARAKEEGKQNDEKYKEKWTHLLKYELDEGWDIDWDDKWKPAYYFVREKYKGLSDKELSDKINELVADSNAEDEEQEAAKPKKKKGLFRR